jgi:hydroxymethylbilane synthase
MSDLLQSTLIYQLKMTDTHLAPIRIGVRMEPWAKLFGIYTQSFLKDRGIESQLILYRDNQELSNALLSAEVSIFPTSLKDLPTTMPSDMVIAALSERDDVRQCLVLPRSIAEKADESTLKGLKIGVCSAVHAAQITALFPDVTTEIHNMMPLEGIEAMRNGRYDGGIMTTVTIKVLAMRDEEWVIRPFNPREFVPEAGQGVACLVVATEDVPTRRLLKKVHVQKVAMVTNVERALKKMFNDADIAAHCERDKMGNYHLSAAALVEGTLRKIRLSQSTTVGLAENAHRTLING